MTVVICPCRLVFACLNAMSTMPRIPPLAEITPIIPPKPKVNNIIAA